MVNKVVTALEGKKVEKQVDQLRREEMKKDETDRWLKRQEVEEWDDEIGEPGRRELIGRLGEVIGVVGRELGGEEKSS